MQQPSPWVAHYLSGVPQGGTVLDVACGGGRHLRLAMARGHGVVGVDRDLSAVRDLAGGPGVRLIEADLEGGAGWPLREQRFSGVVVTNYLWRPILSEIVAAVASDGVLIYETFARGHERFGRPTNPDFLLAAGELFHAVTPALVPIAYQHATCAEPRRVVQRICAVGVEHAWITSPPIPNPGGDVV